MTGWPFIFRVAHSAVMAMTESPRRQILNVLAHSLFFWKASLIINWTAYSSHDEDRLFGAKHGETKKNNTVGWPLTQDEIWNVVFQVDIPESENHVWKSLKLHIRNCPGFRLYGIWGILLFRHGNHPGCQDATVLLVPETRGRTENFRACVGLLLPPKHKRP